MIQLILKGLVCLGAIVLLASYGGAVHPLGDSLAVFRIWIAAGLVVVSCVALIAGARRVGCFGTLAAGVAAVPIALMFAETHIPYDASRDGVSVYSKNTLGGRGNDAALVADIVATGADVVLLQEVSRTRSDYETALRETHPHAHMCHFSDWSGIGVVSRWPIEQTYCSPSRSFAAAYILGPQGGFWAVSTHLVWPYPYDQWALLEQALPFLETIEGRTVVAGDFNMVPWSASVRAIERATGTDRLGPLRTTLWVRRVPFQIDHVLATGTGGVSNRPLFASDHYGIFARVNWSDG